MPDNRHVARGHEECDKLKERRAALSNGKLTPLPGEETVERK